MKLDTDTMTATERFLCVIRHEEPDRIPIFLMGVPAYSKCHIELTADNEKLLDEWTDNDEHVLLTPFGDLTTRSYFGAEVETHGIGISYNFVEKEVNEAGEIVGDYDPTNGINCWIKLENLMRNCKKSRTLTI